MKAISVNTNYAVTECGKVYSHLSGRFLKLAEHNHGYRATTLYGCDTPTQHLVHRLVATAYIPNPDNLPTVNHKDGDKTNNHVTNLEWMSYKDNNQHAIDTGLSRKRINKHTDTMAHTVCTMLMDGWKQIDITKSLGLDKADVKQIRYSEFYEHVTCEYDWTKCPTRSVKVSTRSAIKICEMLSEGSPYQKISVATGETVRNIKNIKYGITFKKISCNYSFLRK